MRNEIPGLAVLLFLLLAATVSPAPLQQRQDGNFLVLERGVNASETLVAVSDRGNITIEDRPGFTTRFAVENDPAPTCKVLTLNHDSGVTEDGAFVYTVEPGTVVEDGITPKFSFKDSIHDWGCNPVAHGRGGVCRKTGEHRICGIYHNMENTSQVSPSCGNPWRSNDALAGRVPEGTPERLCTSNTWQTCTAGLEANETVNGTMYRCTAGSTEWRRTATERSDGSGWQLLPNPVPPRYVIHAMDLYSREFGFALAHKPLDAPGGSPTLLIRWNGEEWKRRGMVAPVRLHDIQILSRDLAWAVGNNGTVLRYDGRNWTRVPAPTDARLFGLDMTGPGFGMAAGGINLPFDAFKNTTNARPSDRNATKGVVIRWNGENWTNIHPSVGPHDNFWMDVAVVDRQHAWVAGGGEIPGGEQGRIVFWNGSDWTVQETWPRYDLPTQPHWDYPPEAHTISTLGKNMAWVLGDLLYQWDGTDWRRYDWSDIPYYDGKRLPGVPEPIYTSTATQDQVYMAGQVMPIMRWNVTDWYTMPTEKIRIPTARNIEPPYYNVIWAISMVDDSYGMAGGLYGKIYLYNGD